MVAQIDPLYRRAGLGPTWVRILSWALFEGRPLTTRGRWFNPIVLALHHLHCRLPRPAPVEAPIFVAGMGRSGTTLLGKILSLHPRVGFLNEPKALWHVAVGREDIVGSYQRGPARYRLDPDDATPETRRRLERLFAAYLRWTGRRRVVDKSPEVVYRADFVRAIFPRARLLYPVRNGWAVCRSVERWSTRHRRTVGDEVHDWWGADRRKWRLLVEQLAAREPDLEPAAAELATLEDQRQMAALEWILTSRHAARQLERSADILPVRYEELTASPLATIASVLEFCHLPSDERVDAYCRDAVRPAEPARPFALPEALEEPFQRALEQWGYDA
ncbi:MAG: sulfotransferase [Thermoanaerobaculia bacterium]|nr:sulfotransferase [Thermoanaerobaculia bacterium]